MHRLAKGEARPLNVTQEARHRVFVGLGWDPNEDVSLIDKARALTGGKKTHHDLDLSCYIFDVNKRYIGHVSIEEGRETDQTGQIYHSGDNVEGIGEGDDEQISVELKDLDPVIHYILFKAAIKSGHHFGEVNAPKIRMADGYSGHTFLHTPLNDEGADKEAFVFACLFKSPDGEWALRNISRFIDTPGDGAWAPLLKEHLK